MLYEEFVGLRSRPVMNLVERGQVRRFAEAIADSSPLYTNEGVAAESRYGRLLAPPTFPRTFDYGRIEGLELPSAGLIHGEFGISYERPLLVGDEVLGSMQLKDSYDKRGRRGLHGFSCSSASAGTPMGSVSSRRTTSSSLRRPCGAG